MMLFNGQLHVDISYNHQQKFEISMFQEQKLAPLVPVRTSRCRNSKLEGFSGDHASFLHVIQIFHQQLPPVPLEIPLYQP